MSWTPTHAIITPRAIPENLYTYLSDETRQADALTWAGGANFKLIKKFSNSIAARTVPVYPSIAFSDDNDAQELAEDLIGGGYSVVFEVSIQNQNPDTAVTNARIYQKAICSMIVNCPQATLIANTGAVQAVLQTMEIGFMPIKTNEKQNDFLQQFQVKVIYSLMAKS